MNTYKAHHIGKESKRGIIPVIVLTGEGSARRSVNCYARRTSEGLVGIDPEGENYRYKLEQDEKRLRKLRDRAIKKLRRLEEEDLEEEVPEEEMVALELAVQDSHEALLAVLKELRRVVADWPLRALFVES